MQVLKRNLGMVMILAAGLAGCTDGGEQPDSADPGASGLVAGLTDLYPVLGEEPAPEPRPGSDANPTEIPGEYRTALPEPALEAATGEATFYADKFEGRRTASGIPFRQNQLVAAHRGFPFGTIIRVTNLSNGRTVNVRVVDRGPFGGGDSASRPIIDLSRRAATRLGFIDAGRARVRVEVLQWGEGLPRSA